MMIHRMEVYSLLLCLAFAIPGLALAQSRPGKMKVYISVDMEGVAGIVTGDQLGPGGFEYARFREFTTREALAAVNAAKEAGATEIVVSDSHGNGENLLLEEFPEDVRVIRAWPRRLSMMGGIDSSFDAAILIGYHASTNNLHGVRSHTFSSAYLTGVKLNGTTVTEAVFNAAIAGHFGVPVVMMSGDDAAIAEVRSILGNIEAAETKKTLGFHSADTLTPAASCRLIGEKVRAALGRLNDFKPYTVKTPVTVEVHFKNYRPVEILSYLRGVDRIDSHAIRYQGKDMLEISDFLNFLSHYSIDMTP